MNTPILVAIISVAGSIIVASITFFLTKRNQVKAEWQKEKLNHYRLLLTALSDLAIDGTNKDDANIKFASTANTVCLVAPKYVIKAPMQFHDGVKYSNPNKSPERHDQLLKELMLAIRKDIGLSDKDDMSTFDFHLIGSKPTKTSVGGAGQSK